MPPITTGAHGAERRCDFVGARRLRGEGREPDEIGFGEESAIMVIEVLVEQHHLPLRRSQPCHHEKAERLPHPITIQVVRADLAMAYDRIARIHKIESHTLLLGALAGRHDNRRHRSATQLGQHEATAVN